jgi:phospholipid/cholesterol/gamma-HCH transport system substrate-binding protein
MATQAQKVKVGVFLISSLIFFLLVLILISGVQRHPTSTYYVIFNESVTGMDKGGEVRFNGVPVGQVDDIQIGERGSVLVTLKIRKDRMSELREGMTARLALRGITGIVYVEIYGEPRGAILPPGSTIPSEISFIANITASFPQMLDSLNAILNKTNKALGEPDTRFQQNLEALFKQIKESSGAITRFTNNATSQTIAVSASLTKLLGNLDRTTSDMRTQLNRLIPDLDRAINTVNERVGAIDIVTTQKKIHALADRLTSATATLDSFLRNTERNASDVEYDLRRTLRRLQSTMSAAESLLRTLERDPSILLYGRRPPEK